MTRNERLMLILLSRQPIPTWCLSPAFFNADALATFNALHKAQYVEPVTPECHAYTVSDAGRAMLMNAHGPSLFDLAIGEEDY